MSTYEGTYGRLPDCYGQRAHAVIVLDGSWNRGEPLTGWDVLRVSHPGNQGFGMYVLGHALFGKMLLEQHHRPSRLRSLVVVPRKTTQCGCSQDGTPSWCPRRSVPSAAIRN